MGTTKERHARIEKQLNGALVNRQIESWQKQGDMPGIGWNIESRDYRTRTFTTPEIEAFLFGLDCLNAVR